MANDKWLEELGGKLREHGSEVNPQLWQGISSQIGAAGAGAAGGLGFAKIASIIGIAVTTVAVTYFAIKSNKEESVKPTIETANTSTNEGKKSQESVEAKKTETPVLADEKTNQENNQINTKPVKERTAIVSSESGRKSDEIATPLAPEPLLSIKEKQIEKPKSEVKPEIKAEPKAEVKINENKAIEKTTPAKPTKPKAIWEIKTLPNTFTPNNDGVNDEFYVETSGLKNFVLVVMDNKNNVVWQTDDQNAKWDGRNLGGDKLPNGSYLYFITAEDGDGNPINKYQRLEIQ